MGNCAVRDVGIRVYAARGAKNIASKVNGRTLFCFLFNTSFIVETAQGKVTFQNGFRVLFFVRALTTKKWFQGFSERK